MFLLFFAVWVVFNGRLTLEIALFGIVVAGAVFAFVCRFMDYSLRKELRFYKRMPAFFQYLYYLIKEIILANDLYEDWVRMETSLKRAAEFSPLFIRNGKVDSVIAPNHLMMQNYYLLRAISAAEKIRGNLSESVNAD